MNDRTQTLLYGARYEPLELLGAGGMGQVWRAEDRLTGEIVALKCVQSSAQVGAAAVTRRLALAREFSALSSLRHPNIIGVLDYGFAEDSRPFFTMELLEGAQTIVEAAHGQSRAVQMNLLLQVLQALAYLHRRGILHRDLKPSNILVNKGRVRVLDFGLAMPSAGRPADGSGTPNYMAPEILLEQAHRPESDLYAVGVIAYEIFVGKHPFGDATGPVWELYDRVLHGFPELSKKIGLDPRIASILGQLFAKNPEERPDVNKVMLAGAEALGQPLPPERAAVRESYLRAAAFVGRERELKQLSGALDGALQGAGSTWLLAGESGAGKSRILDEVRVLALVRGAVVLRANAAESSAPFAIFSDAVLQLLLRVEPTEFEASVLKSVFSDLPRVLGRDVPNAQPLDPVGTATRLTSVIVDIFARYPHPVVLLLDDCHLVHDELQVLAGLNKIVHALPLLIIAAYRHEERPRMAEEFPEMRMMRLERLSSEALRELITSILGDTHGRDDAIAAYLERETEGNVFFAIEVVRALAEEAGRLESIGIKKFPKHILSAGIRSVVQRRLERVPESARPCLQLAAVFGRDLDLDVIGAAEPDTDLGSWAAVCAEAAVLEPAGYWWRFAHDKLREALLAGLPRELRREIHRRIGHAIEQVHGDSPEWVPALALHWKGAEVIDRACQYHVRAAVQMLSSGMPKEAVEFAVNAVRLLGVDIPDQPHYLALAIGKEMGEIYRQLGPRRPADLLEIPELTDERARMAIDILSLIQPAAFISHQLELFALSVLKTMSLTLTHGAGPNAPYVYASFAAVTRTITGDSKLAYEYSTLAMDLDVRRQGRVSAPVAFVHTWFINHWIQPVRTSVQAALDGARAGFEQGDFLYGSFNAAASAMYHAAAGAPLDEVIEAAESAATQIAGRVYVAAFHCQLERQFARALAGDTRNSTDLEESDQDASGPLASILQSSNYNQIGYYCTAKLRLHFYEGEYREALRFAEQATPLRPSFEGEVLEPEFMLFHALAATAWAREADGANEEELRQSAEEARVKLAASAELCEANFLHKAKLVEAELLRNAGDDEAALVAYQTAADSAGTHRFTQHEALAHELAARLLWERGETQGAARHARDAVDAYRRWGARAKVRSLEREMAALLASGLDLPLNPT